MPATYTLANPSGDPVSLAGVDSGVGSTPAARPSAFSPFGTTTAVPSPSVTIDAGTGSQMGNRANVGDRVNSTLVTIDPGLIVSG